MHPLRTAPCGNRSTSCHRGARFLGSIVLCTALLHRKCVSRIALYGDGNDKRTSRYRNLTEDHGIDSLSYPHPRTHHSTDFDGLVGTACMDATLPNCSGFQACQVLSGASRIGEHSRTAEGFYQGTPACWATGLHRPPVGTFVPGIVSRGGSVVGGRANCDGGGRRLVGSIVGSTGVKNASPWADFPPKAMSPFAVETRSPGRNVGSFFTPSGARPKGSLPLQVQFATSSLR